MTLPWLDFYRTLDPNEKLLILNDLITGLFDEFMPFKTRHCVDSNTTWFALLMLALCLSVTSSTDSGRQIAISTPGTILSLFVIESQTQLNTLNDDS
jgi:hypothetical protein